MKANQLKPASSLAQRFGVKSVIYGGPGTGKTPLVKTCPRPVMCAIEPGMLTMRDATNIPAWEAHTVEKINEFHDWLFKSHEAKSFDTVCIDSGSQMAEIFLKDEFGKNKDGRKAYGEMSRKTMELLEGLYYMPQKHVYLICKQSIRDINGIATKTPYFPGQDLNIRVPHLFDEVWHIGKYDVPGVIGQVTAIRTVEDFGVMARDRSGRLAELEQPNIGQLFKKCLT